MPKRIASVDLDKDINIGEGDETISHWHHGFDVIDEISRRLWNAPELEWAKIERDLNAYPEFVDSLERLEGKRDLLDLFEKLPGASLCRSFYDHGSPGVAGSTWKPSSEEGI
jgi:hypothetical protein